MSRTQPVFKLFYLGMACDHDRNRMICKYAFAFALVSVLAAKQIRFQTDEATWMSVDISPDGQTLVFDMLGGLYTLPAAGGKAKAIASGPAFDAQPRFSPDGKQIAFTSDRDGALNLWIVNADGTAPRQLSKWKDDRMFSPAWLPDGKSVVVSVVSPPRQGAADLWRYPLDGGAGERIKQMNTAPALLVSAPAVGVYGTAPSRDGAYLYWASVVPRIFQTNYLRRFPGLGTRIASTGVGVRSACSGRVPAYIL